MVAEEGGKILGMASISFNLALRYNGEYCQLEELVVDQDARGKNIGGLLIEVHALQFSTAYIGSIRSSHGKL